MSKIDKGLYMVSLVENVPTEWMTPCISRSGNASYFARVDVPDIGTFYVREEEVSKASDDKLVPIFIKDGKTYTEAQAIENGFVEKTERAGKMLDGTVLKDRIPAYFNLELKADRQVVCPNGDKVIMSQVELSDKVCRSMSISRSANKGIRTANKPVASDNLAVAEPQMSGEFDYSMESYPRDI